MLDDVTDDGRCDAAEHVRDSVFDCADGFVDEIRYRVAHREGTRGGCEVCEEDYARDGGKERDQDMVVVMDG